MYTENEIRHKELAPVIMEADKCRDVQSASWSPRKSQRFHWNQKAGKSWSRSLKAGGGAFVLLWGRVSFFVLFRPLMSWMRPVHGGEGNLLSLPIQM